MTVTIRVPWEKPYDKDYQWNELLAWTVETYGLPGERVSFHPTEQWMDFTFDDKHDALMFQLKTGGYVRSKEEYTIDFVNGIING